MLERHFPFSEALLKLAVFDVIDKHGGQADRLSSSASIISELSLFERVSRVRFDFGNAEAGSHLVIRMLTPAPDLSLQGKERALNYLADSIEQLVENSYQAVSYLKQEGPDIVGHCGTAEMDKQLF